MAKTYSSRKRPARRARINNPESKPAVTDGEPAGPPDFAEILGRFSDALALVETAHSALESSLEDETSFGPGVLTLHRGLEELLSVYTEFDFAIMSLKSGAS
jgi:hypothetical protein